jgi:hypothetical protein
MKQSDTVSEAVRTKLEVEEVVYPLLHVKQNEQEIYRNSQPAVYFPVAETSSPTDSVLPIVVIVMVIVIFVKD